MGLDTPQEDYSAFGRLVRERRQALGLSQESLAQEALGNPDRKSFVSAIENARLAKITPSTAKKLSAPLGLTSADLPANLRWSSESDPSPIEERLGAIEARLPTAADRIEEQAIALFLNRQMTLILKKSMSDIYRERLARGLELLRVWTGRPFSLQSFLACYALGLLYVVVAGNVSFFQGDIALGNVRLFRMHEWAVTGVGALLPYLGFALLILCFAWCWRLVRSFGTQPLSRGQVAMRLGGVALVAGMACGLADYLGTASLTAAAIFSVPSVAAISTLPPMQAAFYGAAGGVLLGLVAAISSGFTDGTLIMFMTSLSEGFIIGGIVGLCAGLASSLIARGMADLRPGQLAAAGGGVGIGALVSLVGLLAVDGSAAISPATLGLFAVSWVALPIANAASDFLSLGVSHTIGRHIAQSGPRAIPVLGYMVLDLALAIAFMVLTVVMVGLSLRAVTWGFGVETMSGEFLARSAGDPWGQGLWLTVMALTTVVWTWLHFGLVVAPMAAGATTRVLVEERAAVRLVQARGADGFDASVGVLVLLRSVLFHAVWFAIAMCPLFLLAAFPELMGHVLRLGSRIAVSLV